MGMFIIDTKTFIIDQPVEDMKWFELIGHGSGSVDKARDVVMGVIVKNGMTKEEEDN
jgi:hypothetical protein